MEARLLYAITGHGYGHATRSLAIAREIREWFPRVAITYSTAVSPEFLTRSGMGPLPAGAPKPGRPGLRVCDYEPGTMDRNCFEVDPEMTCAAYGRFLAERERRLADEVEFLKAGRYGAVVSDIAALPIAAAGLAGVPAVAVSNFTWDWILEPILSGDPDAERAPAMIAGDYRSARTYLRLPFHPPEHPFGSVEDLPLVGRRAQLEPSEVRRRLGGLIDDPSHPVALLTVGGLGARGFPPLRVMGCSDVQFVVAGPLPVRFAERINAIFLAGELPAGLGFADLVGAADVVIAKPGYGICSECAANGRPLLAVERRGFRESEPLLAGLRRMVPCEEIRLEEFLAGDWERPLRKLLASPPAKPVPADGAAAAARRLGEIFGW